jgi:hypothetical protein
MPLERREFLKLGGLGAITATMGCGRDKAEERGGSVASADHTLRIAPGLIELAPDRIIATTLYNGQFPGPLLRMREGRPVTIDLHNDTDTPEQLHWHGQFVPVEVDGAAEEGTPFIPAHGQRRIAFTPGPAGVRFYHTHSFAGPDLRAGQYGGQVGIVYIEPAYHLIQFRYGFIDFLAFDSPKLFADLQEEAFLDLILSRQPYPAGVQRLGVPGLDECFGFVPLLALGGKEDGVYLDRGGLWEHIAVITQYAGPPTPRPR